MISLITLRIECLLKSGIFFEITKFTKINKMIGVQRKKQTTNLLSSKTKLNNVSQFSASTLNKMLACPNVTSLNGFKGLKEKSRYLSSSFLLSKVRNFYSKICVIKYKKCNEQKVTFFYL